MQSAPSLLPVQDALRPVLLRRMKEDVEALPGMEEVVVWVELMPEQRHYYRAIFDKQVCWSQLSSPGMPVPGHSSSWKLSIFFSSSISRWLLPGRRCGVYLLLEPACCP